jgi:NADH:ubiquinone oxidoreductase subunit E
MQRAPDEGQISSARVPSGWDEAVDLELDPATIPDPFDVEVPDDLRADIEAHMAKYPDRHSAALPALGAAQERHGWCSPEAIDQVAAVMQVTPAYLSSVATFYDMLRTKPIGSRYVYVCTSVACHVRNAKAVYDALASEAQEQDLEDVDLREFECLGACDMAPMASFDGRYVGPLGVDEAGEIVSALKEQRTVLPGRGLGDEGFRLPWDTGAQAAQSAGPEANGDGDMPDLPDKAGGEPPETPEGDAA